MFELYIVGLILVVAVISIPIGYLAAKFDKKH